MNFNLLKNRFSKCALHLDVSHMCSTFELDSKNTLDSIWIFPLTFSNMCFLFFVGLRLLWSLEPGEESSARERDRWHPGLVAESSAVQGHEIQWSQFDHRFRTGKQQSREHKRYQRYPPEKRIGGRRWMDATRFRVRAMGS